MEKELKNKEVSEKVGQWIAYNMVKDCIINDPTPAHIGVGYDWYTREDTYEEMKAHFLKMIDTNESWLVNKYLNFYEQISSFFTKIYNKDKDWRTPIYLRDGFGLTKEEQEELFNIYVGVTHGVYYYCLPATTIYKDSNGNLKFNRNLGRGLRTNDGVSTFSEKDDYYIINSGLVLSEMDQVKQKRYFTF
jgi:hypothetical protein